MFSTATSSISRSAWRRSGTRSSAGSVSERDLLDALFTGKAQLADSVAQHMGPPLPLVGAGEPVASARRELQTSGAVMVVQDGKPAGVLTRADLLGFLAE